MKLRTSKEAYWISIGEGEDKAEVFVEPLSQTELNRLRKKHTTKKFKRGQMTEDTNFYELHRDRLVLMIKGWKGVLGEDGEEIRCTPESILLVADLNDWFITELLDRVDRISEDLQTADLGN